MKNKTNNAYPGKFITFEGGDGCGKSTNIQLLKSYLENKGYDVLIIREPGGTKIGEKIRDLVLDKHNMEMSNETELLLYEASRAQIVSEVIKPALEEGKIVVADRFFDSSVAYQGYGRGINIDSIKFLNYFATGGLFPDRTILLVNDNVEKNLLRAQIEIEADRLEMAGLGFHKNVCYGFKELAQKEPDRFRVVNIVDGIDETFSLVHKAVRDLFE